MKKAMDIKITGASGYLGQRITAELRNRGHKVSSVERELLYGPAENLAQELKDADAVINLAGAPVLQRWNTKNKKVISTRTLAMPSVALGFSGRVLDRFAARGRDPQIRSPSRWISSSRPPASG